MSVVWVGLDVDSVLKIDRLASIYGGRSSACNALLASFVREEPDVLRAVRVGEVSAAERRGIKIHVAPEIITLLEAQGLRWPTSRVLRVAVRVPRVYDRAEAIQKVGDVYGQLLTGGLILPE